MNFIKKLEGKYNEFEKSRLKRQNKKLDMQQEKLVLLKRKAGIAREQAKYSTQISQAKKAKMDNLNNMLGTSSFGKTSLLTNDEDKSKKRREVNDYW